VPQFVSSAVNVILGIEIQNMNGCVGHKQACLNSIDRYTLIEQSVGYLPTTLIEYINLVLQNKAGS